MYFQKRLLIRLEVISYIYYISEEEIYLETIGEMLLLMQ